MAKVRFTLRALAAALATLALAAAPPLAAAEPGDAIPDGETPPPEPVLEEPLEPFFPPAPPPPLIIRWHDPIFVCVSWPATLGPAIVDEMRETLPRAAAVWGQVTNLQIMISFADRPKCGMLPPDAEFGGSPNFVAAELIQDLGAFASADSLGNTLGRGGRLRFATQYAWNDWICGIEGIAGPAKCRFGDAVHEFGHLLGFSHDHISHAAPTCIDLRITSEQIDRGMAYYDRHSVMNYCNVDRWRGKLSAADICSAQVAYPPYENMGPKEEECYQLAAAGNEAPLAAAP